MEQRINKLFKNKKITPEEHLSGDIWTMITTRQMRETKISSFAYGSLGLISLGWLVFSTKDLISQFSKSGLYEYISLLFSDGGSVAVYWKEFALNLASILPTTSLILFFLSLFALLFLVRRGFKQFRNQVSLGVMKTSPALFN